MPAGSFIGEKATYIIFYPPFEGKSGLIIWTLRRTVVGLAFFIGAPWLIRWWGLRRYLQMFLFIAIKGFEFEFYDRALSAMKSPPVKGVIHCGASTAMDSDVYTNNGISRVLWIEALPALAAPLHKRCEALGPNHICASAAVSSTSGEVVEMSIVNNSISSSLLQLGHGHRTYLPFLSEVSKVKVTTVTLDDLMTRLSLNMQDFNVLYIDVQGSELLVLQGASNQVLGHIDYIYTEVSSEEHYINGVLLTEIDDFLCCRGFKLKEIALLPLGHGNALYTRFL